MDLLADIHYLTEYEKEVLKETLHFASKAHQGQFRDTGEAFIMHPIEVASMLAKHQADLTALQAALLHDVVEDTPITIKEIKDTFGASISFVVNVLTKGEKPATINRLEFMESYYSQILMAAEKDIRVALIKIFDRLHNIQTLHGKPVPKQVNYANETLTFFAPLAKKLGLRSVLLTLEEEAFFYLNQQRYKKTRLFVNQYKEQLYPAVEQLENMFQENEIILDQTPIYSLYSSLQYDGELENEIYIRIHTSSIQESYTLLGKVHSVWRPISNSFKDYTNQLATPFEQYLETKVEIDPSRKVTIKIMTQHQADAYDSGVLSKPFEVRNSCPLNPANTDILSPEAFIHEYFQPMIKVYNQHGDIVLVPEGATVVDYLFHVYGEKAFYTTSVSVNQRKSQAHDYLKAGDHIQCQIGGKPTSSSNWIHFATTRKALMYLEKQRL